MNSTGTPTLPTQDGVNGPFIVLEGVSGIGKTTLATALRDRLSATTLHTLPAPHDSWSVTVHTALRPLPQFAFYLSGLLHASDLIRQARALGPVVADRYVSSMTACLATVHRVPVETVAERLLPFREYLVEPTRTFYLTCTEEKLRERLTTKQDTKADDHELLAVPGRLTSLMKNFERVAAQDTSAVYLDTSEATPNDLADNIISHLEPPRA
ncbi:thymidylate kinase (plasmid) [Streptomyces albidoflavus]|uniref:Thymidylate kinase n=1 Tax=Streptomyces albidoflavus TaxID=1886 RepID=A0AB37X435_9ACTN|nr:thymidylate kinase [Streptomyces albidoflavus]RZE30800.1 thymidylate kinase [Streptomyces albidoflavus]WSB18638.1 thymidylate kinase [Streptomyces albidoflavus]